MRPSWIGFILGVAACGGGSAAPDAFSYGERCEPGGSFDLDGARAAVLGILNVHIDASGLVEADTTAELLLFMDIVQDGTSIEVVATPCDIKIPDVPIEGQDMPIHFEVTQATIDSVGTVSGTGTLSSANQTCATVETSELVVVFGARLDEGSVATAPLPEADDEGTYPACLPSYDTSCDVAIGTNCACDQEADVKPGATLLASNVPAVELDEVYVALRTLFSLTGEVHSSDLVLGEIDAVLEQGILGCHMADGDECSAAEVRAVKTLNPEITQQPGNPSLFRAVRIEETATCAEVIERRDELFPR
jgi:hypothetical protein